MRYLFLSLGIFLSATTLAQEELQFKEYSFAEFFQMIEDEEDSVFTLRNAIINADTLTDKDFLSEVLEGIRNFRALRKDTMYIQKALKLENVFFEPIPVYEKKYTGILDRIVFLEPVEFTNVIGRFHNIEFKNQTRITLNEKLEDYKKAIIGDSTWWLEYFNTTFNRIFLNSNNVNEKLNPLVIRIENCLFEGVGISHISTSYLRRFDFENNKFEGEDAGIEFGIAESHTIVIADNNFGNRYVEFFIRKGIQESVNIVRNTINIPTPIFIPESSQDVRIDWDQFTAGIIDGPSYYDYQISRFEKSSAPAASLNNDLMQVTTYMPYIDSIRLRETRFYKGEMRLLGTLNAIYKRQHDTEAANASYIALKDLETARLKYLYGQSPSFDTFFEWKVNQFLKTFSDYGTRPAKAITMSVYVVFFFALIYLFFPNHWDSHGKDRILHRYQFFFKYLNKDAGMHDVYLEGKKDELAHYDGFKSFFIENGKHVPKFFLATALPLYRWSTASTRTSSWLLSKIDIFRGKWSDLPAPKRAAKTIVLSIAFLVALTYDVFIKVLNALMLSINTFTTLGFGEIPIKGLPRYLAIIQGFIGWFMLTIFSVSLISQLLN